MSTAADIRVVSTFLDATQHQLDSLTPLLPKRRTMLPSYFPTIQMLAEQRFDAVKQSLARLGKRDLTAEVTRISKGLVALIKDFQETEYPSPDAAFIEQITAMTNATIRAKSLLSGGTAAPAAAPAPAAAAPAPATAPTVPSAVGAGAAPGAPTRSLHRFVRNEAHPAVMGLSASATADPATMALLAALVAATAPAAAPGLPAVSPFISGIGDDIRVAIRVGGVLHDPRIQSALLTNPSLARSPSFFARLSLLAWMAGDKPWRSIPKFILDDASLAAIGDTLEKLRASCKAALIDPSAIEVRYKFLSGELPVSSHPLFAALDELNTYAELASLGPVNMEALTNYLRAP